MKFLTTCLCLVFSCVYSYSQDNLKDYYYQFGKKKETKIYQYVNANDSTDVVYWKVITNPKSMEIITYALNANFEEMNKYTEKIVEGGALLKEFIVYEKNLLGFKTEKKAEVLQRKVYSWNVKEVCVQSYKMKYSEIGEIEIQKKREFQEIDSLSLNSKNYEVAKFIDTRKFIIPKYNETDDDTTYAYYAKGLGMIRYRTYSRRGIEDMVFQRLFTPKEFEQYQKN